MGQYGDAARPINGGDGFGKIRPAVGNGGGFAFAQIFGERLMRVAGVPLPHQPFGKVGARHHFGIGGQRQCAFRRAVYAFLSEFFGDAVQAFGASSADLGQQRLQGRVCFVKIQPDNVDGALPPSG